MALIVIIDDRATNLRIFSKLAASIEPTVTVRAFASPAEALLFVEHNTPDLVVTDFKMPDMDGAEFVRRFRERPALAQIPIIVITIYEDRDYRMRALEAGATDFLNSPVDHHEFLTRARNLLKLRKQQILLATRADDLEKELEHSERSREQALRDSKERLAQVIDTVPAMVSATDVNGRILFINAYQANLAGIKSTDLIGQDVDRMFGADHSARSRALDRKVLRSGKSLLSFEEDIVDHNGTKRVFLTTKSPLHDGSAIAVGVLTSSLDITDRKRAENHLLHMAHHDALTGLPNRALLLDRVRREIARTRRGDRPFALHLIDLDGFKNINDGLGHSVGDNYLKAVAERLMSLVRDTDTVARLGGDEFAILQTHVTNSEDAADLARRAIEAISAPWTVAGQQVAASASIGVALHPSDGSDAQELLKNTDLAMYRAKAEGGNVHRFYASDMNCRAREALVLDVNLREAIAQKQFVLYYQPQVALPTGQVVGAEALIRWQRPGRGLVDPTEFLARAEENGLIIPINEWVLREACREAKAWQQHGLSAVRIAVNLSSMQFYKQNVPLLIAKILADTGLEPCRLDLELTESIVLQNTDSVSRDLQQLRELGVSISIDDFGTRYSTLNYVKHFAVDRLKIDQCFIRELASDPSDAAIVRAIVSLAHSLEMEVVAEGVETAEQLALLRAEGCDEVQGFYFGRPMRVEDFIAFASDRRPLTCIA
jgi:diguanylate cyclase (GGDEF)-like protein/PAS domain S-box-containing protein